MNRKPRPLCPKCQKPMERDLSKKRPWWVCNGFVCMTKPSAGRFVNGVRIF